MDGDALMSTLKRYCVGVSDGKLYVDKATAGTMAAVSSSIKFTDDKVLSSVEHNQHLYIADYGDILVEGTDGVLTSTGTVLDAASTADWTTKGIDKGIHAVYIYNGSAGVTTGIYALTTIAAGTLTLVSPGALADGTCSYKIFVAPKYYDPALDSISFWIATYGLVPLNCSIITRFRDRIVLAGDPDSPHLWYMSRLGDPMDWDYYQPDVGRAVAGQNTDAGAIGDKITAVIPTSNDYLIFGCHSSLWMLYGDPANGGQLNNLSYNVNVLSATSWCYGPGSEVIFMSSNGLYAIAPGSVHTPQSITEDVLPVEFQDIDVMLNDISMAFDARDNGIHIFITSKGGFDRVHYWFDWRTKTFWPVDLQNNHDPVVAINRTSYVSSEESVLMGCRDGYIRQFDSDEVSDDGTAITNYVEIGPIRLGNGYTEGMLAELIGTLGTGSGDVTWEVAVGKTVQEALAANPLYTGVWTDGRSYTTRPRARGDAMILKLSGEANATWALEEIQMTGIGKGKHR